MPIYALGGLTPKLPPAGLYWIAPDAHVIGKVELGEGTGIWFGTVLRGDNEPIVVGKGSNIQEGVMIHTDPRYPVTIGENCTIGHHAIIHGCTIGDNSLVGMSATILNGAKIGNNCLVGANALVTEGKEFPPGYLIVGSPAKAIRPLDDTTKAMLKLSADHYVAKQRAFAAGLRRLD